MKKVIVIIGIIISSLSAQAQYGGVIRALNDAGLIAEIRRDTVSLKVSDSLARIRLGLLVAKDSATMSRKGVVILNTVPISGTVTSTSDSTTGSRIGVKLITNPTITNDSSTLSRKSVVVTNTVTVAGTVTSTSDSTTGSRRGVLLLSNPTINNDSSTLSRRGVVVLNTVPISGTVTSSDSSTASRKGVVVLNTVATTLSGHDSTSDSRKGVVLLANPTIANTTFAVTNAGTFAVQVDSSLQRSTVKVSNTVPVTGTFWQATQPISGTVAATQSGTWTMSNDSTSMSRRGVVLLSNPTITNTTFSVTPSGTFSVTVSGHDSTTDSRKGVVLLANPTVTNDSSTMSRTTVKISSMPAVTVDSTSASRKGVVLLANPTITNDSTTTSRKNVQVTNTVTTSLDSSTQRKGVVIIGGSVTATSDSTTGSRKGVVLLDTAKVKFTRLKASTDTVAISGSISATAGATAIYDSTWTASSLDTTGIGALASSATVGWRSDTVGIRWRKCTDYKIGIKLTMANTTPANDKAVYVYLNPWFTTDGGTTWYSSDQGTTTLPTAARGSSTIASPNDLILLGVLSYTTQNMTMQRSFTLSQAYGSTMPDAFSLVIVNYSGAAIGTSNNIISVQPVNKVQR